MIVYISVIYVDVHPISFVHHTQLTSSKTGAPNYYHRRSYYTCSRRSSFIFGLFYFDYDFISHSSLQYSQQVTSSRYAIHPALQKLSPYMVNQTFTRLFGYIRGCCGSFSQVLRNSALVKENTRFNAASSINTVQNPIHELLQRNNQTII